MNEESMILSEFELVSKFGTKGQRISYENEGHFIGNNKRRLLDKVRMSYEVEELKDRQYRLTAICETNEKDELNALKKSRSNLYKYICPLILRAVVNNKKHRLVVSCYSMARIIEMINEYYNVVEHHRRAVAEYLEIEESVIHIFYGRVDSMVNNFIVKGLEYLWRMRMITFEQVHLAQHFSKRCEFDGKVSHVKIGDYVKMTDKEMRLYNKACKKADEMCEIGDARNRYFGKNASRWNQIVDEEMRKHKIINAIWGYDIRVFDLDKCNNYLKSFEGDENIPKKLSLEFRQRINNNAKKEYDKDPEKYKKLMVETDRFFLDDYEFISKVVIDHVSSANRSIREYQSDIKGKFDNDDKSDTKIVFEKE